jgi:hypothetical protein
MADRQAGESLRGLTGAGSSKVGVDKAMRARDVSREQPPRRPGEPAGGAERREGRDRGGDYSGEGPGSSGSSPDSS